ncbi:cyclase family protein [Candidatus Woesearchaeota archaeon]|nr:cyclase family protein [Candidatus Woesearchaeota archaeon]
MNKKTITLGGKRFQAIKLYMPLDEKTAVFPGDPTVKKTVFSDIITTGYQHHVYELSDHHFRPHGDAPNHQNPELQQQGFETFGMDHFFNNAFMIDLTGAPEAETLGSDNRSDGKHKILTKVLRKHLDPFREQLQTKTAVIIRTGYDRWLEANNEHYPENIPYLSEEAADMLAMHKNLRVFGTDSLTVDAPGSHHAHQKLKRMLIVEGLVHLHEIPVAARREFDLQTSTVAINGATGGPITAFAFVACDTQSEKTKEE